jgi:hypothetical protein
MDYRIDKVKNAVGQEVYRFEFENVQDLEQFFIDNMIGNAKMSGRASKAIGTVLLVWDKK